jgi:hypothetical protein
MRGGFVRRRPLMSGCRRVLQVSEGVALDLPKSGVIGTWFGSGSEPRLRDVQMAIGITDVEIVLAVDGKPTPQPRGGPCR